MKFSSLAILAIFATSTSAVQMYNERELDMLNEQGLSQEQLKKIWIAVYGPDYLQNRQWNAKYGNYRIIPMAKSKKQTQQEKVDNAFKGIKKSLKDIEKNVGVLEKNTKPKV